MIKHVSRSSHWGTPKPVSLQDLACCVHLEKTDRAVQHHQQLRVTHCPLGWLRAGGNQSLARCEINPRDWSHAMLRLGQEDGGALRCSAGQEFPPRVCTQPGRRIPVKSSICRTGIPSAGTVMEALRCLNYKVVGEAGAQGLVQGTAASSGGIPDLSLATKEAASFFLSLLLIWMFSLFVLLPCASGP